MPESCKNNWTATYGCSSSHIAIFSISSTPYHLVTVPLYVSYIHPVHPCEIICFIFPFPYMESHMFRSFEKTLSENHLFRG